MRDHDRTWTNPWCGFVVIRPHNSVVCHTLVVCAFGLLVLMSGCGDDLPPCPEGSLVDGRCVALDASRPDAASDANQADAASDAATVDAVTTDAADRDAATQPDSCMPTGEESACDGVDDDCDGVIDEGVLTTFFADADEDGWGDSTIPCMECADTDCPSTTAWTTLEGDCDDTNAEVHPVADPTQPEEVCDGLDNDCDGVLDDGVLQTFYRDLDGDGFGSDTIIRMACSAPSGFVTEGGDCDDRDDRAFPGQTMFFSTPRAGGDFDFDCDGTDTMEYELWDAMRDDCSSAFCTGGVRWQGEPRCGAAGQRCACLIAGGGSFCSGPNCTSEILRCR